ncbi:MAG: DUF87 domain-containing protein [Clostridia bacterium]|nr:DUF87 domain-containing protein [Clostridia bacterium]
MTNYTDKISQYLQYSSEIEALEGNLPSKEKELQSKYSADYLKLERELRGYLTKIKPTVETVCSLYKGKAQLSDGRIRLQDGILKQRYDGANACDVAMAAGNESIKLLSAIIQRVNVDANLREFAIRYNTVTEIYSHTDSLLKKAVAGAMDDYRKRIDALKSKRQAICRDAEEFEAMVTHVLKTDERLRLKAIVNDQLACAEDFATQLSLPLGYEACSGGMLGGDGQKRVLLSLLEWKLHENGVAVIRADRQDIDGKQLSDCAVNTVIQFLFSYPASAKRILLCDSCSSNTVTTFAGILKNSDPELFFDHASGGFIKNSDEDIRASLQELNRIINERIMLLGQSHCKSALEYNHKNRDNPMPIILTLLDGYPFRYENAGDSLESILKNGSSAGVFFLIIENTHEDEDFKYLRKRLPQLDGITDLILDFKVTDGEGYLYKGDKGYLCDTCGDRYDLGALLGALKPSASESLRKTVYLDSVVEKEDFADSARRRKYAKTLSIPIGKQGSNPISVELSADDLNAHLAIIGTTGSGKTAFINSLILSASKLYSPAELELHLILMVKKDFSIFEEEALPHLKTMVTGNHIFAANDVLDFIDEEMKRRSELIGSYGSIYAYNEVAAEPLPRCMIIIDEFYQLVHGSSAAIDRINRIAQVGRSFGISLVISSINFPIEINSIIPLFGNRIEFASGENAGQLIPQAASRQNELTGAKGLCFYSRGGNLHSVTVAFSGEGDRLKEHIQEVKNKYPDCEMELRSEIRAVRIGNEGDAPFTVKRAKRNYDEDGIIRARLGTTYLSGKALEYPFDSKNNLLFLFGHYLKTKMMEASLIKDTLVLSRDVDEPTVYYIDYNKNASLKRAKTVIKSLRDGWVMSGKMVYSGSDEAEDTLDEIKDLIRTREDDEESELYPVLVVIAKADELFEDDDECESLCELISRGKECNVYFAIQCNEPVRFYGSDKYVADAVIFPDRCSEGEEYSSVALCAALEEMPAASTEKGKKLLSNASTSALDPMLHVLCDNNKISVFIPYEYDEDYLRSIVD